MKDARGRIEWSMQPPIKRGGTAFATALFLFFILCSLFVGVFAWCKPSARVSFARTYFLLVRDCGAASAGAVAGESYLAGGAGYLWEEDVVVLACYFDRADAAEVEAALSASGVEVRTLEERFEPFSLTGEEAAFGGAVEGNLKTADSCARLLYDAANGLERGEVTQEEARAAAQGAASALKGLKEGNEGEFFGLWNAEIARVLRRLTEIAEGIVFPKDLRYEQAELVSSILRAQSFFT